MVVVVVHLLQSAELVIVSYQTPPLHAHNTRSMYVQLVWTCSWCGRAVQRGVDARLLRSVRLRISVEEFQRYAANNLGGARAYVRLTQTSTAHASYVFPLAEQCLVVLCV